MRRAVNKPCRHFDDLQQALRYIKKNLTIPIQFYIRKSPILHQKTLDNFI
jgi:hypothetical protein